MEEVMRKQHKQLKAWIVGLLLVGGSMNLWAEDEEFVPAYQNEGSYDVETADKYFVRHEGRNYYTSGKKNGFRVNENNEESTDETIGILTFLLAPATIVYMNVEGFWN
jgi:hypothetical protein